jgi:hypothetical protein
VCPNPSQLRDSHFTKSLLSSGVPSGVKLDQEMKDMKMSQSKMQVTHAEDTPAYSILQQFGLLNSSYRKATFDDLFDNPNDFSPNASRGSNILKRFKWGVYWTPGCGLILYVRRPHVYII